MTRIIQTKSFAISKGQVWRAYLKVKANHGAAGVDKQSLRVFEENLKPNLYKLWNRMASGSYFPPPVLGVEIEKKGGGTRLLGIPTVADRIAQTVVKETLEPDLEPYFHEDSYGFRPGKSALDAVGTARKRCWKYDWVLDVDIKAFFDEIDHELLMRAIEKHTKVRWVRLYIKRWLKVPVQMMDGTMQKREQGTPQGDVISPLLANLFLHYAFDVWMSKESPNIPFERYADDVVCHCITKKQTMWLKGALEKRLAECKLKLHPEKTQIAYCKDYKRREEHPNQKFDFLGYTFRVRMARTKTGDRTFFSFLPGVSKTACLKMRQTVRSWKLQNRIHDDIFSLAKKLNPIIRGWLNYYGEYYKSALGSFCRYLNEKLVKWVRAKYKRYRTRHKDAWRFYTKITRKYPELFAHWKLRKL